MFFRKIFTCTPVCNEILPLFEMYAGLPSEIGKGMHHISKSIYLRQIKVTDLCLTSQNLSEKYIYMSQCETGVQVKKYFFFHLVLKLSLSKIDSGNRLFRLPVGGRSLDPVHRVEASSPPTPPLSCLPFLARKYELFLL